MSHQSAHRKNKQDHHFSLKSVCWGYRDSFARIIDQLYRRNLLGPDQEQVTRQFFSTLEKAETEFFDHVLHEFLKALSPRTQWIMALPAIFSDITETGILFAEYRLYYGTSYFKILGEGGFGKNPEEVRNLLTFLKKIWKVKPELAFSFLKGYRNLLDRLHTHEIEQYISVGIEIFKRNMKSGLRFMEGSLRTSQTMIDTLSKECRLKDLKDSLTRLLCSLVGWEIEISDFSSLDSDNLMERGSGVVCMHRWLYLPERIRLFDDRRKNRDRYFLMSIVSAGMLLEESFPKLHGHPRYSTCVDLVGSDTLSLNLFQILEYVRVLNRMKKRWPGSVRLIDEGIETELRERPLLSPADELFYDAMRITCAPSPYPATSDTEPLSSGSPEAVSVKAEASTLIRVKAEESVNVFHTASLVKEGWTDRVAKAYPGIDRVPCPPFSFLPDFLFPGRVSVAPPQRMVADMRKAAESKRRDPDKDTARTADPDAPVSEPSKDKHDEAESTAAARYIYDEWSQMDNDYFRDHCFLKEITDPPGQRTACPPEVLEQVSATRRIFEYLKPAVVRKEKYLAEGDLINPDLLVDYLIHSHREPSPKIMFYEKPRVNTRDLAVLILLDLSGSTGTDVGQHPILDIEKHSALILAQGLESLGDHFCICGFSGQGRENCEFFVFKDFHEQWESEQIGRVLHARPRSSTRIGVALRHAGYRLTQFEAKHRLIILITDG
ncbi:MAG TPA: hypothetical protein VMX75_09510, partial [Spirochaetia bacterium]|nr:hypothetical protein [Spirochaetia bacterium]